MYLSIMLSMTLQRLRDLHLSEDDAWRMSRCVGCGFDAGGTLLGVASQ